MLKKLWRNSFLYRKIENFIEAKIERFLAEKVSRNNLIEQRVNRDIKDHVWYVFQELGIKKITREIAPNVCLHHYMDSLLAKYVFYGNFEQDELSFLKKVIRPGDTFLDIGANIGLFSLMASPLVASQGKVISFEPSSNTHQRLMENIALNKFTNVETHQIALSNQDATAELNITGGGFDAWNSLATPSEGKVVNTEEVKTMKLDSFVQNYPEVDKIAFIKLDVEGWEIPVIEGGKMFLGGKQAPHLLVEFTEENAQNAGYSCKQLYDLLVELGYSLYTYNDKTHRLIEEPLRERYPYMNIVATKSIEELTKRINSK